MPRIIRTSRERKGIPAMESREERIQCGFLDRRLDRRSRRWSGWGAALALLLLMAAAAPAAADDYDATEAGHPVRIVAYVLHPVGVLLDYLLMRPAHWLVSHEPFSTVFGHEEEY